MEEIFWQAAGPLNGDDEPAAVMPAGMPVGTADGMLANLADTPANRAFSGSTGTADDSAPFPQLRVVAVTARAGRATLGAIPGRPPAGEQTLLRRLVKRRPELFAGRQRHSRRAQKARPKFPHTSAAKTTVTGKPQVTVSAPGLS